VYKGQRYKENLKYCIVSQGVTVMYNDHKTGYNSKFLEERASCRDYSFHSDEM
jgi:hypothetical protein